MKKKVSEIVVRYKNIPHNIFSSDAKVHSNQLVLRIHPDEGVDLKLNTKEPSVSGFNLEELPLDLNLQDYYEMGHQDCYERLLLDVIKGNQALFVRKDEIEASNIPPHWHAWLHKSIKDPPINYSPKYKWQKDHEPNKTGTNEAYFPSSHPLSKNYDPEKKQEEYKSWTPN